MIVLCTAKRFARRLSGDHDRIRDHSDDGHGTKIMRRSWDNDRGEWWSQDNRTGKHVFIMFPSGFLRNNKV